MVASAEGLSNLQEASPGSREFFAVGVTEISCDWVVHRRPEPFDGVGAGTIDGLKQQARPRIVRNPGARDTAVVDAAVVGHDVQAAKATAVEPPDGFEQTQEESACDSDPE